jgi:cell division protein FtsB
MVWLERTYRDKRIVQKREQEKAQKQDKKDIELDEMRTRINSLEAEITALKQKEPKDAGV